MRCEERKEDTELVTVVVSEFIISMNTMQFSKHVGLIFG
jgi:hypothetical protein